MSEFEGLEFAVVAFAVVGLVETGSVLSAHSELTGEEGSL